MKSAWILAIIAGVVSVFLFTWGYSTNTTYIGVEHLPVYIGFAMLAVTLFAALYAAFG